VRDLRRKKNGLYCSQNNLVLPRNIGTAGLVAFSAFFLGYSRSTAQRRIARVIRKAEKRRSTAAQPYRASPGV
jgi:hypothetical protein